MLQDVESLSNSEMSSIAIFDVSDGRCGIIVSIPDHCIPFYFESPKICHP